MAEDINATPGSSDTGSNMGAVIGAVIIAIVLIALAVYLVIPALRGMRGATTGGASDIQLNVPEDINVNVPNTGGKEGGQ